jgi:hypothetical protein
MGHDFISGVWKTKDVKKTFQEAREQAESYYGTRDGYSGALNAIYDMMPYSEFQFQRDLGLRNWDNMTEQEYVSMWKEEKDKVKKLRKLQGKHDLARELTMDDLVKLYTNKRIPAWKKWIINYFWHPESDICYTIEIGKNKVLWFGWARC